MNKEKETPEERRERMRQEELKQPSSSVHGSGLQDLVGGIGWKGTFIIIIVIIAAFIIYQVFF
ncbi:hypothetical protein F9U64_06380 [Gracilibacillus oryzae]|uniref:Phage capsid protein n=1 Tax=Gracilibacillus oryzae TaxID=1672701 RepID=A0A7C8GU19_9BACI|nr:DUF6366 family protein [Gracilibacillus oryzae]KAB8138070.1 hypothetical protein F9U64_06380 [Gracilibacillus oryzae]